MCISVYTGEADMLLVKFLNIPCSKRQEKIELPVRKFTRDMVHLGYVSHADQ